jgi:hypothetical protein
VLFIKITILHTHWFYPFVSDYTHELYYKYLQKQDIIYTQLLSRFFELEKTKFVKIYVFDFKKKRPIFGSFFCFLLHDY